jgi:NAD(P)-dependent dehydrogenase (short-subunit alcohol dehydrogenase family)
MNASRTLLVIGAGPGLGLAVARRFGKEGYAVGLVSRSAERHPGYLDELRAAGVQAVAVTADVRRDGELARAVAEVEDQLGPVDVVYHGPGASDPSVATAGIIDTTVSGVRDAHAQIVEPAVELAGTVLPAMRARGRGAIVYVAGLSAVVPLPFLGAFAPASAALRTYGLTLSEALAEEGVQVGVLVVGGLIVGGDIHEIVMRSGVPEGVKTLDPDDLANAVWRLAHDEREIVVSAIGPLAGTSA